MTSDTRLEPARLVRVVGGGFDDDLYALDETNTLWSFERHQYKMMWIKLPPRAGTIIDMYVHVTIVQEVPHHALRVLDDASRLWELRWCNSEYLWDAINLEAR